MRSHLLVLLDDSGGSLWHDIACSVFADSMDQGDVGSIIYDVGDLDSGSLAR